MTFRMIAPATFIGALALAGCALVAQDQRAAANVPPGQVIGEAVSCVQTNRIQSTSVHGDEVIDFHMAGNTVYRNTLPDRCYSLGFEKRFAYQTTTGQLCNTDTITVLHADGSQGTTCGLGRFLPIELPQR